MKEDKELQEKLKKEFETPDVPFEEWAAQMGIFTGAAEPADCSVYEPADNVNGHRMPSGNRKKILSVTLPLAAVLVAVAIILVSVFLRPIAPKIYGMNDAVNREIDLQEITEQEDIYLFKFSNDNHIESVNKDVLIEDNSQVLLYTIQKCLLSVENGEGVDAFYVSYQIRTYPYYEFFNYGNFSELNTETTVHSKKIEYSIKESHQTVAYARFSDEKYEYFIEVCGFESITVLNEDNFLNLLNKILI